MKSLAGGLVILLCALMISSAHARDRYRDRPSPSECDTYAKYEAERYSGPVGGAVKGGAAAGIFGAIVGGKKGAKRGAALGAILGGISSGAKRKEVRRRAYRDCMDGYVRW